MSTNLYWEPVRPSKGKYLCDGLKWAIQKHFGHDEIKLSERDIGFLNGVAAAAGDSQTSQDCQTLIDAIEAHDSVRLWME